MLPRSGVPCCRSNTRLLPRSGVPSCLPSHTPLAALAALAGSWPTPAPAAPLPLASAGAAGLHAGGGAGAGRQDAGPGGLLAALLQAVWRATAGAPPTALLCGLLPVDTLPYRWPSTGRCARGRCRFPALKTPSRWGQAHAVPVGPDLCRPAGAGHLASLRTAAAAPQVQEIAGALGWRLSDAEVAELDAVSAKIPSSTGAPFENW